MTMMTTTKHFHVSLSLVNAFFFSSLVQCKHFKHPHIATAIATGKRCLRSIVYGIVCICLNLITICIFSEWVMLCTHNFIVLSTYIRRICAFCFSHSSLVHSFAVRWCDRIQSAQYFIRLLMNRINGYCDVEQQQKICYLSIWIDRIWNCFTLL